MEYRAITLPDSGEVVLVQPLPPLLLGNLKKNNQPPPVPVQRVNMGTPDSPIWEEHPNEADPDYIADREAWAFEFESKMRLYSIKLGTRIEWTDEKRAKVQLLRDLGEQAGEPVDDDDTFVYVAYVAIRSSADYNALLDAIGNSSRPTEEAITEQMAQFRPEPNGGSPDISREEHIFNSSSA